MAVLSRSAGLLLSGLLLSCSVGVGEGEASGLVTAPDCGLEGREFNLRPDFFVADEFEDQLEIRMQNGGDYEFLSNGIAIYVDDVEIEEARLGTPIPLSAEAGAPIRMTLYLHKRCIFDRDVPPVHYVAAEGTITFEDIFAPDFDDDRRIAGRFDDVRFVDTSRPEERFALFSGNFDFLFNRGRPAQRFP
ncbi:MAG: hypothetical protein AAGE52_20720 [Myxococcota bacterium]